MLAKKFFILLTLTSTLAGIASANAPQEDSCTPVDLRNRYPFFKTASDQGSRTENCYAFAAADLVSTRLNREVSALDISNTFEESSAGKLFSVLSIQGGLPHWAIEAARKKGFCSAERVRSSGGVLLSKSETSLSNLKKTLADLKALGAQLTALQPEDRAKFLQCRQLPVEGLEYFFPKMKIEDVISVLSSTPSEKILSQMISFNCDQNRIEADFKMVSDWGFGSRFSHLAELTTNNQLSSGNGIALGFRGYLLRNIYVPEGEHAALIIGRRWDLTHHQCEYLIRNSWGTDCNKKRLYDPFFLKNGRCENGNIWIPGDLLFPRTHLFIYLK